MKKEKSKILLVMLLCITMIGTTLLSSCATEPDPEEPPAPAANPLTGATADQGYDESSAERRIAAFVVENTPDEIGRAHV